MMRNNHSRLRSPSPTVRKQRGSFAIELAFVLVGLCAIFLFATDLSYQLLLRANLDRSSYALVNVLKERTRYFDADITNQTGLELDSDDLLDMQTVAARMLNKQQDEVAIQIESLLSGSQVDTRMSDEYRTQNCSTNSIEDYQDLAPIDNGVYYPLYRVTLCAQHDSWFQSFFNSDTDTIQIVSSSVIAGR
ncbi:tight adherence pilus pseudopilin TadF [Vibrio hippocampi]|uniref:Membrane associated secretion system protein n=1 Tax=Vibrio hippocampi TaxID=654686 RepID=A0ABN8DLN3_9VIBR|nr:tight adherence pilus pseudopilin TadF [Vibrio hippocampi]CAH0529683.1 hypothetical protein VHP8226_03438 [Vibrio hippocampi]